MLEKIFLVILFGAPWVAIGYFIVAGLIALGSPPAEPTETTTEKCTPQWLKHVTWVCLGTWEWVCRIGVLLHIVIIGYFLVKHTHGAIAGLLVVLCSIHCIGLYSLLKDWRYGKECVAWKPAIGAWGAHALLYEMGVIPFGVVGISLHVVTAIVVQWFVLLTPNE